MERYIALDVHWESTTAIAGTEAGKRLFTKVTETRAEPLIDLVQSVPRPRHVVMEEGTYCEWLYEALRPYADDVIVVLPEKRDATKLKSDEADAFNLFESARTGRIKRRVFKDVSNVAGLREAVRTYHGVSRDKTRVSNQLLAALRSRGVAATGADACDPDLRKATIDQLPEKFRERASVLGEQFDKIDELHRRAAKRLQDEAKGNEMVKLLGTAPGIGPIGAATIVAVVVDPHRFRTKRQFWSYCGLGIVTVASAQWGRKEGRWVPRGEPMPRGLNRNRNPWLKNVFKVAAHVVVGRMPQHPLHQDYERMVRNGTRENLATLTLARRIAGACLAMWKHKEAYDSSKHSVHQTA